MDIEAELKKTEAELKVLSDALVAKREEYQKEFQAKSQALQAEAEVKNKELQAMANKVVEAQGAAKKLEALFQENYEEK